MSGVLINVGTGTGDQGATDARAKLFVQKEVDNVARCDSLGFHCQNEPGD